MIEVGRDSWKSPQPPPLLKQGHLEPPAHDRVQTVFEDLQGFRLHSIPGHPVPVPIHPNMEKGFP